MTSDYFYTMAVLTFSGHESFICKQFWLKKVFDFAVSRKKFSDDTSVVDLGVGKNMVSSLRYWGKAFDILDDNDLPTPLAVYLFGENGKDIYLEDIATLWLLHYHLIKKNKFSVANLLFNDFRKERVEFTKSHLISYLLRVIKQNEYNTDNENTIEKDINVLIRMYSKPDNNGIKELEEDYSGILIDLDLIERFKQRNVEGNLLEWFRIIADESVGIPCEIILYSILDNYPGSTSVSFRELLSGKNSPGSVFALSPEGLYNSLSEITDRYHDNFVYSETAGNQILQIRKPIDKAQALNFYYGK